MNEEVKNIKDLLKVITSTSNKVFIVGHIKADLDSLASAIGLQTLCESLGKDAYIVLDEPENTMEPIVKKIREEKSTIHNIISLEGFELLFDSESSLIVTDTNKEEQISVKDYLPYFKDIIIVDHHNIGDTTIKNASIYIPISTEENTKAKVKVSSASEIVAQLLLQARIDCDKDIYTYLYGGIYLDTNRFDRNIGEKTYDITHKLCAKGADIFAVKELFLADFDEDKIINDLVFNGTILKAYEYDTFNNYTIGFTLNREKPQTIYSKEQIAKAADRMMQYRIEAEFAMGYIDEDTVKVSARSKGVIDVGKVMEYLGGGGNSQNAATEIQGLPISTLEDIITIALEKGIRVDGEIIPAKDSTVINAPKQYIKKDE